MIHFTVRYKICTDFVHELLVVISQLCIYTLLLYVQHSSNSGGWEQNKMAASRSDDVMKCLT